MTRKSQLPYRLRLRLLAVSVETDTISPDERAQLAALLRALADGQEVGELLGHKAAAHRPQSHARDQRIWDVAVLMLPIELGGEGMTKDAAIERVAGEHHVSVSTLEDDYKSSGGKRMRDMTRAAHEYPAKGE